MPARKELRLVCTADLHIGDWPQFSQLHTDGRPSRLLKYLDLAHDIVTFAKAAEADVVIIAGDLVEQSLLRPMVIDVLNEFIEILTKDLQVIVTHGQHDLDTKTIEISKYHSALSHLKGKSPNLTYADAPTIVDIKGWKILVAPWTTDHVIPEGKADVFVGHGIVRGTNNWEGYVFQSGFQQHELAERFRLSVIGDIHNGQPLWNADKDRLVLVPGGPLQNTYKDSPTPGLWKVTISPKGVPACGFTATHDIRPNHYHRFLFTDEATRESSALTHYRYRSPKAKGRIPAAPAHTTRELSIQDACMQVLDNAKIEDKAGIRTALVEALQNLRSEDRKIPQTKILNLTLKNFMSISDFTLNFDDFPDNLVIIGENGHGKTSIFEGAYWTLTGKTTKDAAANDVVNDYAADGICEGMVHLLSNGLPYRVHRRREAGKPSLDIQVWDDEEKRFTAVNRTGTNASQEIINNLIGLNADEILMLCYFSAKEPVLFGTLGQADKNTLMATISGMGEVDALRTHFSSAMGASERDNIRLSSQIQTLRSTNTAHKDQIREMLAQQDRDVVGERKVHTTKIAEIQAEIAAGPVSLPTLDAEIAGMAVEIRDDTKRVLAMEAEIDKINATNTRVEASIAVVKQQLRTALGGHCPSCKQALHDEGLTLTLNDDLERLKETRVAAHTLVTKRSELVAAQRRLEALSDDMDVLQKRRDALRELHCELGVAEAALESLNTRTPNYESLLQGQTRLIDQNNATLAGAEAEQSTVASRLQAETWIYNTLLKRNGPLIQLLNHQVKNLLQVEVDTLTQDGGFKISIDDKLNVAASYMGRRTTGYKKLSSGQERIVDVVMMCALNNLFTKLYGLSEGVLGVVIFDEVLSYLDDKYLDFCFGLLDRCTVAKKLVITHDARLMSRFDSRIQVRLSGEGSSVYTKSWG